MLYNILAQQWNWPVIAKQNDFFYSTTVKKQAVGDMLAFPIKYCFFLFLRRVLLLMSCNVLHRDGTYLSVSAVTKQQKSNTTINKKNVYWNVRVQ